MRAGASRTRRWVVLVVVAVVVLAGVAVAWSRRRPPPPVGVAAVPDADQDADVDEAAPHDPGYVGPSACAACHAARVAEFRETNHFRACRLAGPGVMSQGFDPGRGAFTTRESGLRFEMARAGNDYLQTAVHPTPAGDQRVAAHIDLVYGAGAADQVFFTWRGDQLFELPMVWLQPFDRWGVSSINRYGSGDYSREATTRCIECHNTSFGHVPGTHNEYKRDHLILGVTCERCHGPGREHVAFHQAHPDAESGQAIVRPSRLTRERQLEVCTQCHSNTTKRRGPAFQYRPGEPLEAYFRTATSEHPEQDHVANQIQYLRQSKCFQKSDSMACTTCHNPHRPGNPAVVEQACLKCHRPADCGERSRLPVAVQDNCTGCHMPPRVWMNVHFHTEQDQYMPPIRRYDHRIAIYPEVRQEVLLAWYRSQADDDSRREAARLKEALVRYWLDEAEGRRRAYRYMAAIGAVREALRFDPPPAARDRLREAIAAQAQVDADWIEALHQVEEQRYAEATATLTSLLALKPDSAGAHGRLGTLYAIAGQRAQAVEHLQAVARCDPDDPYGQVMLGWLAYLDGRLEDAVEAYQRADEIEPYDAKIHYQMGLALVKLGRLAEAVDCFRKVVTIDPKHAGGCQALAETLRQQGQTAEAVRLARRAARLTEFKNPDVLLTLAEAYAAAGRDADAERTAAEALDAAQAGNPELAGQIRRRLEEIRARARHTPS
jgi:tetratricopeptide (TPR) repeat protein